MPIGGKIGAKIIFFTKGVLRLRKNTDVRIMGSYSEFHITRSIQIQIFSTFGKLLKNV